MFLENEIKRKFRSQIQCYLQAINKNVKTFIFWLEFLSFICNEQYECHISNNSRIQCHISLKVSKDRQSFEDRKKIRGRLEASQSQSEMEIILMGILGYSEYYKHLTNITASNWMSCLLWRLVYFLDYSVAIPGDFPMMGLRWLGWLKI